MSNFLLEDLWSNRGLHATCFYRRSRACNWRSCNHLCSIGFGKHRDMRTPLDSQLASPDEIGLANEKIGRDWIGFGTRCRTETPKLRSCNVARILQKDANSPDHSSDRPSSKSNRSRKYFVTIARFRNL